jgi:hypothetical protein
VAWLTRHKQAKIQSKPQPTTRHSSPSPPIAVKHRVGHSFNHVLCVDNDDDQRHHTTRP